MAEENLLGRLWNTITGWADKNADQYSYILIPKDRTDATYSDEPLKPYRSYFRFWLCDMFLTKSRKWFEDCYPAVNCSIRLKFGDQEAVNLTRVASAPKEALGKGVLLNYHMTELMPYSGGVVEVAAALIELEGKNYLAPVINLLKDFSGLVAAPVAQVLNVAEKVSNGVQSIMGATNGTVHLALHQSLTSEGGGGKNDLRPGYIAVILASEGDLKKEKKHQLYVKEDRLHYTETTGGEPKALTGFDYMLFRLEGRSERDDWRLKNIQEPLNKAIEASLQGEAQKAEAYKKVALTTALQSPDLAVYDRRRVAQAIQEELAAIKSGGLGATAGEIRNLNGIMMARAISMDNAAALGEMTFEELFA